MSEKSSECRPMREVIAAIAGPRSDFDNRKSWLADAARKAGVTPRMMKALWYGEITDDEHKAARRVREKAQRLKAAKEHGRRQAVDLAARFDTAARALAAKDAHFHRDDIAGLVAVARILRGVDSSGTGEGSG